MFVKNGLKTSVVQTLDLIEKGSLKHEGREHSMSLYLFQAAASFLGWFAVLHSYLGILRKDEVTLNSYRKMLHLGPCVLLKLNLKHYLAY